MENGESVEYTEVTSRDDLTDNANLIITGRVDQYREGGFSFTIVDGLDITEDTYRIFIEGDEPVVVGEYVQVRGVWLEEQNALDSVDFKVLTEEEKRAYFKERFAYLEIEVADYTENIDHTCVTPKFTFNIENKGKEIVTHQDLYDEEYPYAFYFFIDDDYINEDWNFANGMLEDIEDYGEVFVGNESHGLDHMYSRGFLHFDELNPNQSMEIEYWAGGHISRSDFGVAGTPNIYGNSEVGDIEISFGWGIKNNYEPIFLYLSEPVTVNLASSECKL